MLSNNNHFVSSNLLLRSFLLKFLTSNLSVSILRKPLPKSEFSLGDWVWIQEEVDDPYSPDHGKPYKLVGYVVGIVYHHPELIVRDVHYDYGYYVEIVYRDGLKVSFREPELCPEYGLHLLG